MRSVVGRVLLLVLPSLLASFTASGAEPQWLEVHSPHFSVITDAGQRRGQEAAVRFEQMRAVFGALLVKTHVNLPVPLQIVAFRNSKELRQVVPLWHGKPIQVAGLFQQGQDRSFIMLDMSVDDPWKVVFHEYAHQLMSGNIPEHLDPWFEEGFAEYFSTIEVDGKQARVGKIPHETYEILRQRGMMKIADLFRVRHNSSIYNEGGDHRTVFYAESAMLVHYLYDHNLIPKLALYFTLTVDKGLPIEDAIQQTFGMNASQFDKALLNYMAGGEYRYYTLPTPADIVEKGYGVKPLAALDARTVIADIHLHSIDYQPKAVEEFEDVLKEDPNNANACRGLGYAYLQKGDYQQAGEYFKKASRANDKDPRVHYYSALLMIRENPFAATEELSELAKELDTAISLDPTFADAYALRAFAMQHAGQPAKALADIQKAVSLSPRNESYQYNLAQVYLANNKVEDSISVLRALSQSSDVEVAKRAAMELDHAQRFKQSQETWRNPTAHPEPQAMSLRETPVANVASDASPVKFVKGTIIGVDCSAAPAATLTVLSGAKTWKMQVRDSKQVLVLGADGFSCDWKKQKVALNYRETGEAAGTVVSIEVQ